MIPTTQLSTSDSATRTRLGEEGLPANSADSNFLSRWKRWGQSLLLPRRGSACESIVAVQALVEGPEEDGFTAVQWGARLLQEKEFLLALVGQIEAEFLSTGEGLSGLTQNLHVVQVDCQSLADQTLGRAEDAGVQFAFQLLKKAEDLVLAGYEQYEHVFTTFAEVQRQLVQLGRQQEELMRILLPLNIITVGFRIEASRHPAEVRRTFLTLADNVNRTVEEVRGAMEQQFGDLKASELIVEGLIERISAAIRRDRKDVTTTLASNRRHLMGLNAALANSGAGVTDIVSYNQSVNRHVGRIVMAQQCQDITRQKIEHICEALDGICEHLDETAECSAEGQVMSRRFTYQVARIQLRQIQCVFDELNSAAEDLRSGIQGLNSDSAGATAVALKVGSSAIDTKVAAHCEEGIDQLLAIIQHTVLRIGETIAAFAPLHTSFMDCTSKATDLAIDVRHAALNAQIFALQAPDGASLGVLSGQVREVADEAILKIGSMGTALHQTIDLVSNLQQRLAEFQEMGRVEETVLTEESLVTQQKLSGLEEAIPVLVRKITERQSSLGIAIERLLVKVRFPDLVAEASARTLSFFDELLAWGAAAENEDMPLDHATQEKLDRLLAKYTMDSERRNHAAIVSGMDLFDIAADERGADVATAASADDLGDNIELF